MTGVATLVPPTTTQPPAPLSYSATPVFGSATADTSVVIRFAQPGSCCQAGLGSYSEQPDPPPVQAVSAQPRVVLESRVSEVPPTEVTYGDDAGQLAVP